MTYPKNYVLIPLHWQSKKIDSFSFVARKFHKENKLAWFLKLKIIGMFAHYFINQRVKEIEIIKIYFWDISTGLT